MWWGMQNLRRDFVTGVLSEEELGNKLFVYEVTRVSTDLETKKHPFFICFIRVMCMHYAYQLYCICRSMLLGCTTSVAMMLSAGM